MITKETEEIKISELTLLDGNPRQVRTGAIQRLAKSLSGPQGRSLFEKRPCLVNKRDGKLVVYAGNQRLRAAQSLKWATIPCIVDEISLAQEREETIKDNLVIGEWDDDILANNFDLKELEDWGMDLTELGIETGNTYEHKKLSERFLVPPFSVLDARQGYWQDRKREWIELGIQSELGRGDSPDTSARSDEPSYSPIRRQANAAPGGSLRPAMTLENGRTVRGDGGGKKIAAAKDFGSGGAGELSASFKPQSRLTALQKSKTLGAIAPNETGDNGILSRTGKYANGLLGFSEQARSHYKARPPHAPTVTQNPDGSLHYRATNNGEGQTGTSIFDPVLCELAYRWFMPQGGGRVIDPFAGGSVRGVVASKLGKQYTGVDLSERQIEANKAQGLELCAENVPQWINGNSLRIKELATGEYDFIFSCPPYADLEIYSDDPADLSRMEYSDFMKAYKDIIAQCVSMLSENRFACFVVGDIRDKKGFYRNFPTHTIDAFQEAGMILYNEAILVTAVGSLPICVGRQFASGRKLGKTHQNVLIFFKGDTKKIKDIFGEIDISEEEPREIT